MGVEIQIEGLTKSFGNQLIWGDVTLTVPAGEICVMLGPSGTGKSVFLTGCLRPPTDDVLPSQRRGSGLGYARVRFCVTPTCRSM